MDDKVLENLLKIVLAGASLTLGAFFTALRSKIASTKNKNYLHISFYIFSGLIILVVLLTCVSYPEIFFKPYWFAIVILFVALVSSIALIIATKKFSIGKYQFKSHELDPVVNKFSSNADKDNIKLLAGNLDFLGLSEHHIDRHPQYICLRAAAFRQIQILCTPPITSEDKMRYGKIITDFPKAELRYYEPPIADLKVRGRIKTLNNVTQLLIYNKISSGLYEALELNTAELDGARYSHLWNLIWELALIPTVDQLREYKNLYRS